MGTNQEMILNVLKASDRPLTTIEIVKAVYGDYPEWEHQNHRSNVYSKLKILEKQGFVRMGAKLENDRMWVIA